ncbi:MAG: radical SAM protein [Clostridia bacterium]|nr:radical SAM protein [Clostridia bacterium]
MGEACMLCPRACGVVRESGERGACGQGAEARVAAASLHRFEEPPISGVRGSGTVFFVGCPLRCVFCQNQSISRSHIRGRAVRPEELADLFLSLQEKGAHNINLVSPTQFVPAVAKALERCRAQLNIPVVYNSSGYEKVQTLRTLEGLVDIYLPDFKYYDDGLAQRYSGVSHYRTHGLAAVEEMLRQTGAPVWKEEDGCSLLKRGTVIRHLVLPGCRKDSMAVLSLLAERFSKETFLVSIMSQYTPEFAPEEADGNLKRRLTRFEYESVIEHAAALGLQGFAQERSSATAAFTPDFEKNSEDF